MDIFGRRYREEYGSGASWGVSSKSDPRFNTSGSASGLFGASSAADEWIRAREKALGVTAPDDVEVWAMKD